MTGAVTVCGDLSARRPGDTEARGTILIASRPCAAAAHSKHAGGNSPIFVSDAFSSVRDRLGITAARGCRTTDHGRPVPISFLGLGRALQPAKQTRSGLTDRFHLPSSLRDAPASEMQEITEGIPDERKPTARDGNLTARERKNAC